MRLGLHRADATFLSKICKAALHALRRVCSVVMQAVHWHVACNSMDKMWVAKSHETTPPDRLPEKPVAPVPPRDPPSEVPTPTPIDDPRAPRPGKTMRARARYALGGRATRCVIR